MKYLYGMILLAPLLMLTTSGYSAPDQFLPELAKDYVYWRAKILLCTQAENPADADKARQRMREAERYLFRSTYNPQNAY